MDSTVLLVTPIKVKAPILKMLVILSGSTAVSRKGQVGPGAVRLCL